MRTPHLRLKCYWCFGPLIHRKSEEVRPRVVPYYIKIEFTAGDLVEIQLSGEDAFAPAQWTGEYFTQR